MRKNLLLILILVSGLLYSQNKNLFDKSEIKKHVEYLASDKLEGRNTPSKGLDAAAEYIAAHFKKNGLKPAGDNGSYFQNFKLHCKRITKHYLEFNGKIYDKSSEILPPIFDNLETEYTQVKGQIVFTGYGISEPSVNYDDYDGIDVKNKIVIFMRGIPNQNDKDGVFNKREYSKWKIVRNKIENAKQHGAIGVIIAGDPVFFGLNLMKYAFAMRPFHIASPDSIRKIKSTGVVTACLGEKAFDDLLSSSGKTFSNLKAAIDRSLKPASFLISENPAVLEFSREFTHENTKNVIGIIEGTDQKLKEEAIVLGAHYDHVGVIDNLVYNGADDDASGTVGIMELASAFSKNKPKRSLLFIAFTGEEQGLLGSEHFVSNPVTPLNKINAMFQFDMISRNEDTKDPEGSIFSTLMGVMGKKYSAEESKNAVSIIGLSYSKELRKIINNANSNIKLELRTDLDSTSLFNASDHYPFFSKNIPVCFFYTGDTPYLHRHNDEIETLNFDKMEKILELAYGSIKELANSLIKVTLDKK